MGEQEVRKICMLGFTIYVIVLLFIFIILDAFLLVKLANLEIEKDKLELKVKEEIEVFKKDYRNLYVLYNQANEKYLECDKERKQLQQKLSWIKGSIVEE